MPPVIEQFGKQDVASLIKEFGGFVFTPSVLIKCLISKADPATFDKDIIQDLTLRAADFYISIYMNEIDKDIVGNNLRGGVVGGCVDDETYCLVSQMLSTIKPLPLNRDIEFQAHANSRRLSLYDSRRLVSAVQHCVPLVTCDPLHFTVCPDERDHIRRFGYADVSIGMSESDEGPVEVKVWVFSPKAISLLLRNSDPKELETIDRTEILLLKDYKATSNMHGSTAEVELLFDGKSIYGIATDPGSIDVLLRATERAVRPYIELTHSNVHLEISDTTANNDVVQIYLRLHFNEHQFEVTVEGLNALTCSIRAYVKAINAALKYL